MKIIKIIIQNIRKLSFIKFMIHSKIFINICIIYILFKMQSIDKASNKKYFKVGEMSIDPKQVFWQMKYCYAMIPIVQYVDGHVLLTTKRAVQSYSKLQAVQVFDLTIATKFLCKALQIYHSCASSTIFIQSSTPLKQVIIHIIPRKAKQLETGDELYHKITGYPKEILSCYEQKMNFYVNPSANKILQAINEQNKKYQGHLQLCFKQQKEN